MNDNRLGWIRLALQVATILVVAGIAWGVVNSDLRMTKYRVDVLEATMLKLSETNAEMALDIREIKTLIKHELRDADEDGSR